MTFQDWRQLDPAAAARKIHDSVTQRLSPAQRTAVLAHLPSVSVLEAGFSAADRTTPLGGVPFFVKDLFDVADWPTRAGSIFLPEVRRTPTHDSAIVSLLRRSGAVLAGKTHLHEFAYGITGENPHYGNCTHPLFPDRTTGGSSSGSAAVVAAGIAPLAIGTDTGGSIRVPAAFCGLYGFRLTPGSPLIADAFPLAPSFDTAGWFTSNAADMLTTLQATIGVTSAEITPNGCYLDLPGSDPDVAQACRSAAGRFVRASDSDTHETLIQGFSRCVETYQTIVAAEAWATHVRWAEAYQPLYDPAVWSRLERGRNLSRDDFQRARYEASEIQLLWSKFFRAFDFLVMPGTPFGALEQSECTLENRGRLLTFTSPASVGGCAVLTVPVALPSGLTTGLQFIVPQAQSPVIGWVLNQL
jgi:amidase/aspartyl-tRNA(Asn)/glutamyl-tRNA(Gln) amidotransferase subunit A